MLHSTMSSVALSSQRPPWKGPITSRIRTICPPPQFEVQLEKADQVPATQSTGSGVGAGVGETVGAAVGAAVGATVGAAVGQAVGSSGSKLGLGSPSSGSSPP